MNAPGFPAGSPTPQRGEANFDPRLLADRVNGSLQRAEGNARRLGRTNGCLGLAGILTSGALTALTGWTSLAGPIFGSSVTAWWLTCVLAAILGFVSTVSMALSQQLRLGDRVARANECIGRLKSLDFALVSRVQSPEEIWKEYSAILRQYTEELR